jgi:hypothetical protein
LICRENLSSEETGTSPSGVSATLFLEFVTAPTETSTPPTVIVKDEGDCTTSGVATTPPTSATGCVGFSRSRAPAGAGNGGSVDDVVVIICSVVVRGTIVVVLVVDVLVLIVLDAAVVVVVLDVVVLDVVVLDVVVVVDVVVELTAAETERDVRGPS